MRQDHEFPTGLHNDTSAWSDKAHPAKPPRSVAIEDIEYECVLLRSGQLLHYKVRQAAQTATLYKAPQYKTPPQHKLYTRETNFHTEQTFIARSTKLLRNGDEHWPTRPGTASRTFTEPTVRIVCGVRDASGWRASPGRVTSRVPYDE